MSSSRLSDPSWTRLLQRIDALCADREATARVGGCPAVMAGGPIGLELETAPPEGPSTGEVAVMPGESAMQEDGGQGAALGAASIAQGGTPTSEQRSGEEMGLSPMSRSPEEQAMAEKKPPMKAASEDVMETGGELGKAKPVGVNAAMEVELAEPKTRSASGWSSQRRVRDLTSGSSKKEVEEGGGMALLHSNPREASNRKTPHQQLCPLGQAIWANYYFEGPRVMDCLVQEGEGNFIHGLEKKEESVGLITGQIDQRNGPSLRENGTKLSFSLGPPKKGASKFNEGDGLILQSGLGLQLGWLVGLFWYGLGSMAWEKMV
ncbi:unnamed protein product [Linum trigynum]|uniref:Uncharacterized protein n=1 Tax=Linum trigynum TaxID=586398 RepID=A0AAV2FR04_9ROSI